MRGRSLLRSVVVFSFFAAAVSYAQDYFPPGVLAENPKVEPIYRKWYACDLRALGEPSLWELSKTQKAQTYRFLRLRTFHRPISICLDVATDGTASLTTKVTDGRGGYAPGRLVESRTGILSKEQTESFLQKIDALNFWNLESYEKRQARVGPDGQVTFSSLGLDGAQWVIEGVREGSYHVVNRWSPSAGAIRALGMTMAFDLAKLKLPEKEVY